MNMKRYQGIMTKLRKVNKTSMDNKVDMMEDNAAYSIHNATLMTMTDCEACSVLKPKKYIIIISHNDPAMLQIIKSYIDKLLYVVIMTV